MNRVSGVVRNILAARRFEALPENVGWRMDVTVWIPQLVTKQWTKKKKGGRFTRKDIDNLEKLTVDGVYQALGQEDSAQLKVVFEKKDGHGHSWVDFMLQEVPVPAEEPNATEMAQEINDRETGVRASPEDPLPQLRYMLENQPATGEYRFTSFDILRMEIMTALLDRWEHVQARLVCPARSGELRACFGCSDMMVTHCVMNNPLTLDENGRTVGVFDMYKARKEVHVRNVERKEEGSHMSGNASPSSLLVQVLTQLNGIQKSPHLWPDVLKSSFVMITSLEERQGDDDARVFLSRLALVLYDMLEFGICQPITKPLIAYKDASPDSMPVELRKQLADKGVVQTCKDLYTQYHKGYTATKADGKGTKAKNAKTEPKAAVKDTNEGEQMDLLSAPPTVPKASTVPPVLQDASITPDTGKQDMPQMQTIPASGEPKKRKRRSKKDKDEATASVAEPTVSAEPSPTTTPAASAATASPEIEARMAAMESSLAVVTERIEGVALTVKTIASFVERLEEPLTELPKKVEATNKHLKKFAAAFNQLIDSFNKTIEWLQQQK